MSRDVGDDGRIFVPTADRFLGGVLRPRRGLAPDLRAHRVSRPKGSDGESVQRQNYVAWLLVAPVPITSLAFALTPDGSRSTCMCISRYSRGLERRYAVVSNERIENDCNADFGYIPPSY